MLQPCFFKLLWIDLLGWGKWITNFFCYSLRWIYFRDFLVAWVFFYVVKWDLVDNCRIRRQRWYGLPTETSYCRILVCGLSKAESRGLLNWFELCWFSWFWPCSSYLVYGFCPRLLFFRVLTDTNWKWQSQCYQ